MNPFGHAWRWFRQKREDIGFLADVVTLVLFALVVIGFAQMVLRPIIGVIAGDDQVESTGDEGEEDTGEGVSDGEAEPGESALDPETTGGSPPDDLAAVEEPPEVTAHPTPLPDCPALDAAATTEQFIARWNDVLAGSCSAGSLDFGAVSPIRPGSENRVDETKRRFTLENGSGITLLLDAEGLVTSIEAGADTLPAVEQISAIAVVALGSASAPAPDLLDFQTRACLGEPDYGRFDAWHTGDDPDFELFVEICPDSSS